MSAVRVRLRIGFIVASEHSGRNWPSGSARLLLGSALLGVSNHGRFSAVLCIPEYAEGFLLRG